MAFLRKGAVGKKKVTVRLSDDNMTKIDAFVSLLFLFRKKLWPGS